MRIMEARVFAPSTRAGRMKWLRLPTPVAGSQPSVRQNSSWQSSASQKGGKEKSSIASSMKP